MFRPNAPIDFHAPQFPIARIAFRQLIHITINPTGIYIRCKSTKTLNMTGALVRNGLNTLCL